MHELSVAQSLIDLVLAHLEMQGVTDPVAVVRVRIGALAAVIPGSLHSAFNQARLRTPLARARIEIESVATSIWCPTCRAETMPADPRRLICPGCRTRSPDVRHGLELELASIELADTQEDPNAPHARSQNEDPQAERRRGPRAAESLP